MKCSNCGNDLPLLAKYCDACGQKIRRIRKSEINKNDWIMTLILVVVAILTITILAGLSKLTGA